MNCPNCGAGLGEADLKDPACRYCGTLHPYVARAAEKVEIVKQLLAPGPDGIPAALQGMFRHGMPGSDAMHERGFSSPDTFVVNGVAVTSPNAAPTNGGAGLVEMPPAAGPPAYGAPMAFVDVARAPRRTSAIVVFVAICFGLLLAVGGIVFALAAP